MSTSVARVGDALRVNTRLAWLISLAGLVGVAALVALATRRDMLDLIVALALVGVLTLVGFRWPIVPLAVFAALIPIEEILVIEGLGTLSRLAGILFAVTYGLPRLGRLSFGAMPPAAWAYFAWAIVSLGWALDIGTAWAQLQTLIQLFLIALLVADFVIQRPTVVRPILWVYSSSAAVTAFLGILTYAGGLSATARAAGIESQNPAQFAAVLLPALVFGLYEVLTGRRRLLGAVIAILTTAGVVVSGTRGAWVAVAVVAAFVILPQLDMRRRIAAIGTAVVLLLVVYQIPGVPDLVADRAGNAFSTGGAGRTDIWAVAQTIYGSAPVLGVGYANFPVAYTPEVVRASDVSSWHLIKGLGPHNVVVGTLIELGPIGLLLLALFLVPLVVRRGWGPDAATVQAALASLVTLALFLDIVGNRKQVWLVIGLAAGLAFLARRARGAVLAPHDGSGGLAADSTEGSVDRGRLRRFATPRRDTGG